ncbi:MAG TPA: DUF1499 domain-containing protein [Pseudolabrys sp.]|nr:DUF1499 domain-containing protein [Pseudolabrys sp.]
MMRSMARGPFFEVPVSQAATWSARLAWFAIAVALLSIIIVRGGFLEIAPALATFAAALMFAGLAILLAFAAFIVIWRQGLAGLGRAVGGMMLSLALLAYPAYLGYRAHKLPAINDITTDFVNPPRFGELARLRPRGRSDYPPQFAPLQQKAYPDIEPLQYEAPPALAYKVALAIVTKRKWHILDTQPPTAGRPGEIEAVARTLIMGFRDDVVVRVSAAGGGGSRIDVRSASRYGSHDFGANAKRVAALLNDIDDGMDEAMSAPARPEPKEKEAPPKKKPPAKRGNRR